MNILQSSSEGGDPEDINTLLSNILYNLINLNIAENVTLIQMMNNWLLLLDNKNYLTLYRNIAGYLAHSDVNEVTYQKLLQIVDILERYLIINDVN